MCRTGPEFQSTPRTFTSSTRQRCEMSAWFYEHRSRWYSATSRISPWRFQASATPKAVISGLPSQPGHQGCLLVDLAMASQACPSSGSNVAVASPKSGAEISGQVRPSSGRVRPIAPTFECWVRHTCIAELGPTWAAASPRFDRVCAKFGRNRTRREPRCTPRCLASAVLPPGPRDAARFRKQQAA